MADETTTTSTETVAESGEKSKRTYTKKSVLTFSDQTEILALHAILNGDKNVHSGWRSHLLSKVTAFLPTTPDISKPPAF